MDCIGVILVSRNWAYADKNGSVAWGPKSDKQWLKTFVFNKICFCGHKTYLTLPESFKKLPAAIHVGRVPSNCEVHLGGPTMLYVHPPKKLIVHKTFFDIEGPKFVVPDYYKLMARVVYKDYEELVYEKQW